MRQRPSGKRVKVWGGRLKRSKRSLNRTVPWGVRRGGVGDEAGAHGGKIYWTVVLVDLNGVAAAEGDVRAAFSGEVGEDALAAHGAVGPGGAGVDFAMR